MENTKGTKYFTRKPSANESMMYFMETFNERTKKNKVDIDRVLNVLNDGFNVLFDSEKFHMEYELFTCYKYDECLTYMDSNFNTMLDFKKCIDKRIEERILEVYFDDDCSDANLVLYVTLFIGTIDLVTICLSYDVWNDDFSIRLWNYLNGCVCPSDIVKLFDTKDLYVDDKKFTEECKSYLDYYINSALDWARKQNKMEKERSLEIKEIKRISKKMN